MNWRAKGGIKRYAADKIFSKVVRERAGNLCEICQRRQATDCAHIQGRAKIATRWSLDNALGLCKHCHDHTGMNPITFIDWLDLHHPGRRELIQIKLQGKLTNNAQTRKLVAAHYRAELIRMRDEPGYMPKSWN